MISTELPITDFEVCSSPDAPESLKKKTKQKPKNQPKNWYHIFHPQTSSSKEACSISELLFFCVIIF